MTSRQSLSVCILSTADWDRPVWTNKQHVARGLAVSNDVTYVNSTGLRWPRLSAGDLIRIVNRLRQRGSVQFVYGIPNLKITTPLTVPASTVRVLERMNEAALHRSVSDWLAATKPKVLWTFTPMTRGLEKRADVVVYHAVDLLHQFPGVNATTILRAERALAERGVPAVASSRGVEAHLRSQGFSTILYWPNVADVELIAERAGKASRNGATVVYAGNLIEAKVDVELLLAVAKSPEVGELLIAGPIGEGGDATSRLSELLKHPNVRMLGTLSPGELAEAMGTARVGLIPYRLTGYTDGIYPMKLDEYLAAGCLVVSTPIKSLIDEDLPGVTLSGKETFVQDVERAVRGYGAVSVRRPTRSWRTRVDEIQALLESRLQRLP